MWAQSLVEYGVLSSAIDAVSAAWYRVDSALGNHGMLVLAGVGLVLVIWLFRR